MASINQNSCGLPIGLIGFADRGPSFLFAFLDLQFDHFECIFDVRACESIRLRSHCTPSNWT